MKATIKASELVLNPDGSIYHLNLKPEHVPDTVITVGDQDRVNLVTQRFDQIYERIQHREFVSHIGRLGSKEILVISTGIGTDNIDIVLNELDALVNIDFSTRSVKEDLRSLDIIRIGTSGSMQADIPIDSILLSSHALGLDGLMNFYDLQPSAEEEMMMKQAIEAIPELPFKPSFVAASDKLLKRFSTKDTFTGITATAAGFYAPQGRKLRYQEKVVNLMNRLAAIDFGDKRITNLEMETAGIYGLGQLLGHHCLSINGIIANRQTGEFTKQASKTINTMIDWALSKL